MSAYQHISTIALFWSDADQNWIAVWLREGPQSLGPNDVAPEHARVSAFGDTRAEALRELSVALELMEHILKEDAEDGTRTNGGPGHDTDHSRPGDTGNL